jgi:hypothetical protein
MTTAYKSPLMAAFLPGMDAGIGIMGKTCKLAGHLAASVAILAILAGLASAQQETTRSQLGATSPDLVPRPAQPPCNGCPGPRPGGDSTPNLALPPECWPPPCSDTDRYQFDPLKSQCPDKDDYFLVPPRPRFYIEADGAAIQRAVRRSFDVASVGMIPTGTIDPTNVVLSTGDFNYDFRAAGRVLLGCTINECWQIEGVYNGVSESENTAAVRDETQNAFGQAGNLFSPFGGFGANPIANVDYNDFAQIRYTSSLQTFELNVRRKVPMSPSRLNMSILFGVRYMVLPENFYYNSTSNVAFPGPVAGSVVNEFHVATDNQMVGPQIGARSEFYIDNRWWANFEIKGALMNNRSVQSTTYTNTVDGTAITTFGSAREDHTAFALDLALTFLYRWSPHVTTRLGYQAVWLQDVSLAPDNLNLDINILRQGPAELNHISSVVYHGPFAGLALGW